MRCLKLLLILCLCINLKLTHAANYSITSELSSTLRTYYKSDAEFTLPDYLKEAELISDTGVNVILIEKLWQERDKIRRNLWRAIMAPRLMQYWMNCLGISDIYHPPQYQLTEPEIYPFAEYIVGNFTTQQQGNYTCAKPNNIQLKNSLRPHALEKEHWFKIYQHLIKLLHQDEFIPDYNNLGFWITQNSLPINKALAMDMGSWIDTPDEVITEFHREYNFPTLSNKHDLSKLSSQYSSYVAIMEKLSWRDHKAICSSQNSCKSLSQYIEQKEQVMQYILQIAKACTSDIHCTPNTISHWFYNAGHIYPYLTSKKVELSNSNTPSAAQSLQAMKFRDENNWIDELLKQVRDEEAKKIATHGSQQYQIDLPAYDRNKSLISVKGSPYNLLHDAVFWYQATKLGSDKRDSQQSDFTTPIFGISEGMSSNLLPIETDTSHIASYNQAVQQIANPTVMAEDFGRVIATFVVDSLEANISKADLTPNQIPNINLIIKGIWNLALSHDEIEQIMLRRGWNKPSATARQENIQIYVEVQNDLIGTEIRQIEVVLKRDNNLLDSKVFNLPLPWPSWFAQYDIKSQQPLVSWVFVGIILVMMFITLGYLRTKSWLYGDEEPRRKSRWVTFSIAGPTVALAILLVSGITTPISTNSRFAGEDIHFYLPHDKTVTNEYKDLTYRVSSKIYEKFINVSKQSGYAELENQPISFEKIKSGVHQLYLQLNQYIDGEDSITDMNSKQIPRPQFTLTRYGRKYGVENKDPLQCNTDENQYSLEDLRKELLTCEDKDGIEKWEPTYPRLFETKQALNSTTSIVFYDGDDGVLSNLVELKGLKENNRVITIVFLTPTRQSSHNLQNRLAMVLKASDYTCILLPPYANTPLEELHLAKCVEINSFQDIEVIIDSNNHDILAKAKQVFTTPNNRAPYAASYMHDLDAFRQSVAKKIWRAGDKKHENFWSITEADNQQIVSDILAVVEKSMASSNHQGQYYTLSRSELKLPYTKYIFWLIFVILTPILTATFYYQRDSYPSYSGVKTTTACVVIIFSMFLGYITTLLIPYFITLNVHGFGLDKVHLRCSVALLFSWLLSKLFQRLMVYFNISHSEFSQLSKRHSHNIRKSFTLKTINSKIILAVLAQIPTLIRQNISLILVLTSLQLATTLAFVPVINFNAYIPFGWEQLAILPTYQHSLFCAALLWLIGISALYADRNNKTFL